MVIPSLVLVSSHFSFILLNTIHNKFYIQYINVYGQGNIDTERKVGSFKLL
jgi:hypothetical protein